MTPAVPAWWALLDPVVQEWGPWRAFADYVTLCACVLSNPDRKDDYMDTIRPYPEDVQTLFPRAFGQMMFERIRDPFTDTLGQVYADHVWDGTSDPVLHFIPPAFASGVAMMGYHKQLYGETSGPIEIADPCCGSGTLILEAARVLHNTGRLADLTVTAVDPNHIAAQAALINLSLAEIKGEVQCKWTDAAGVETHVRYFTNTRLKSVMAAPVVDLLKQIGDPS